MLGKLEAVTEGEKVGASVCTGAAVGRIPSVGLGVGLGVG